MDSRKYAHGVSNRLFTLVSDTDNREVYGYFHWTNLPILLLVDGASICVTLDE